MAFEIKHGDCLEVMRGMADNSVDAIVTDPPYGLSFMGKKWDYDVPEQAVWEECLRVLKPGGHLLAFAGTRTQHRMAVRIEDAGFEIRDMIAWVYGSGFPKSLDVSKAIDKAAGAKREVVGVNRAAVRVNSERNHMTGQVAALGLKGEGSGVITAPATDAARQWSGWGTALKPALEPITMARKPFASTVAANVQEWGTGAINVDRCRVPHDDGVDLDAVQRQQAEGTGIAVGKGFVGAMLGKEIPMYKPGGRWPANLVHDGSDEVVRVFPSDGDKSPARFFYCAKASKADRGDGNNHPTVKHTDLMRYLCRLVTPPGGTVLDPFTGSGSTGRGAILEGFNFIGIEREAEYVAIAEARIVEAQKSLGLFA